VYYPAKAKELALKNMQTFHLAAWARRGSSVIYGTNTSRCSLKFKRVHPDGSCGFHLHAEMDLIRKFKPGELQEISVIRFSKRGEVTMSKPCLYCQKFLREHGVKKARYTNWNGEWEVLSL
jgi:cytidine deaminase